MPLCGTGTHTGTLLGVFKTEWCHRLVTQSARAVQWLVIGAPEAKGQ